MTLMKNISNILNVQILLGFSLALLSSTAWSLVVRNDYDVDFVPKERFNVNPQTSDYISNSLSSDNAEYKDLNDEQNQELNGRFAFLMPNVSPQEPELYLCTPIKVDFTTNYYIVGYEPNATMNTAHHMLLYGCGLPGSTEESWNCGEMAKKTSYATSPPCDSSSNSQIMYAWARDAPPLDLPEGVGFKVGRDSTIQYMVLQVHYAHVDRFKHGATDDSGVYIKYTTKPLRKQAAVLLLGTAGSIPAHTTEHMETACAIEEHKVLHPFAYRTHTHSLGKFVSGYKVRSDERGVNHWTLLGKRDPLTPQMFYPIMNNETIVYGDHVAARCTMESHRDRITGVGATAEDEMCNFYLMYYVDNDEPLKLKYCFSAGPPIYYWKQPNNGFNNIPEEEASSLSSP